MAVDWGFAWQVGAVGFGVVFAILIILGIIIWLVGRILNKIGAGKVEADAERKEISVWHKKSSKFP